MDMKHWDRHCTKQFANVSGTLLNRTFVASRRGTIMYAPYLLTAFVLTSAFGCVSLDAFQIAQDRVDSLQKNIQEIQNDSLEYASTVVRLQAELQALADRIERTEEESNQLRQSVVLHFQNNTRSSTTPADLRALVDINRSLTEIDATLRAILSKQSPDSELSSSIDGLAAAIRESSQKPITINSKPDVWFPIITIITVLTGMFITIRQISSRSRESQLALQRNLADQRKSSHDDRISRMRQAWIDALRADLSEFAWLCWEVNTLFQTAKQRSKSENSPMDWPGKHSSLVHSVEKSRTLIRLRLNPDEEENISILNAVESLRSTDNPETLPDRYEHFIRVAQAVLKREWKKVKSAE